MRNENLIKEQKSREFFNLARFHKGTIILLGDLFDFVICH